eukprot:CAMPEP_0184326650 /NCGR_PEP_ID=MMETSP1049-20130417/142674_1 /TAXON_ID=77928 /ORGANISM="Proteomonas sulcata, Strain CCMP704" /LENGTH=144 /DNA_ID=CAMNT_0026648853 /DNA_START=396 /DNA_END=830 /DNA_ORIENTATION=+
MAITMGTAKDGPFTPIVKAARTVLGQGTFTKVRGDVIGYHSKVITAFCETSESGFGRIALKQLFEIADKDSNGSIDKAELCDALWQLGFTHLNEDQVEKIFARADLNENDEIDFEEFMKEAPSTLRTNLIKLAKNNGSDLGFLS